MNTIKYIILCAFLLFTTLTKAENHIDIVGAGSTFIDPLLSKWVTAYNKAKEKNVFYFDVGSATGLDLLEQRKADFAIIDSPISTEQLNKYQLMQIPIAVGAIVIATHLPEIDVSELDLDSQTVAKIFTGKITYWDDLEIKKMNPDLTLPHTPITVIYRAEGSGTNYNFSHYLSSKNSTWKTTIGTKLLLNLPAGIGVYGSDTASQYLRYKIGAISYLEYDYINTYQLQWLGLYENNKPAHNVSKQNLKAAICKNKTLKKLFLIPTDCAEQQPWPLTATSYLIVPKYAYAKNKLLLDFFTWDLTEGNYISEQHNYVIIRKNVLVNVFKKLT